MATPTKHRADSKAFTLTELLTVLVAVGLLLAILAPNFGLAVGFTRTVKCAGNLHHIGAACAARRADESSANRTPLLAPGWTVTISPYLGENASTLVCPADEENTLSVPDVKLFVWGSGGAQVADYFLDITTSYPYWLEMPCSAVDPPPGIWKVPEVNLYSGGYYGESFGIEGFAGGHNNTAVLGVYHPGPDPKVYWYLFETARYGDDLHAGGDLDYDDFVIRVVENRTARRLEISPIRIWGGQAYCLVGPDGTWWPSGTKSKTDNYWASVGDSGTSGPYYFPMGDTSYGMSRYIKTMDKAAKKIAVLDYEQEVVNVGPDLEIDDGWGALQAPRHRGRCNVLFADGGVALMAPDAINPELHDTEQQFWAPQP